MMYVGNICHNILKSKDLILIAWNHNSFEKGKTISTSDRHEM